MKYLRLLFTDQSFILKWVLLFFIGGIIVLQKGALDHLRVRMNQINYEKEELQRLANIRRNYLPASLLVSGPGEYILEGSSRQQDTFHALINGKVYASGDPIDEFIVSRITLDSAVLVHQKTGETRVLQFLGSNIVHSGS